MGGTLKRLYPFNGRVVAQRAGANDLTYLHADHLGGTLLTTNSDGGFVQGVMYTPWGDQRLGGFSTTTINFTGQRRDDTGLLYYNARYYDPVLGRFISPDTVVPGSGPLTLAPHDAVAAGAWAAGGGGPANPQDLNRYAYAGNNPVKNTDPTGHCSGGSTWNNFASVFDGTCYRKGMAIVIHGQTIEAKALGVFAAFGPTTAAALLTLGTYGLAAPLLAAITSSVGVGEAGVVVNTAYQIAKEGGLHAGLLRNYSGRSVSQMQRGINSLTQRANEHLSKIADPAKYAERWDSMTDQERAGVLNYWQKEVIKYSQQADVLRGLLEEKTRGQ